MGKMQEFLGLLKEVPRNLILELSATNQMQNNYIDGLPDLPRSGVRASIIVTSVSAADQKKRVKIKKKNKSYLNWGNENQTWKKSVKDDF